MHSVGLAESPEGLREPVRLRFSDSVLPFVLDHRNDIFFTQQVPLGVSCEIPRIRSSRPNLELLLAQSTTLQ